ncbi:MAG TPA: cupin domain-containing protein, partial [Alphaproteobacteria bacterium]
MAKPVRRVVTGHDARGKAVALMDAASPHVLRYETGGFTATMLWQTAEMPAAFAAGRDRAADQKGVVPPPRGSVLRIVEFPPEDPRRVAALTHRDVFRGLVAPDESLGPARHPFMHRTDTVDYGIV